MRASKNANFQAGTSVLTLSPFFSIVEPFVFDKAYLGPGTT
jgi:hypothetical protein